MKYPLLGSKFTGPAEYVDTQSGTYWQVLPKLSADDEKLQKWLLAKDKKCKK